MPWKNWKPQSKLVDHLLSDPNVAFVYWRNESRTDYTVHFQDDSALLEWNGLEFTWSPLPDLNTNPLEYPTLSDELDAGDNPNSATQPGYESDDEWLSFVPLEAAVWPHLEERVAQIFEDPNSPDMAYALAPYSRGGGLTWWHVTGAKQSPLLLSGPGLNQGLQDIAVRHIDIAPTVDLLGVEPVEGRQLMGQDGTVRNELLKSCAFGSADHAVLIT